MANIQLTGGFTTCPEGKHIFRIYKVNYDKEFGKVDVYMVNAQGITHVEKFSLKISKDVMNEKACNAFSIFAKTALNNFRLNEIDHTDLVNHYIGCEIVHNVLPNKNDPTKTVTFANVVSKWVADGFDTEPVPKALTLGTTPETQAAPIPSGDLDLNSLLD